MRTVIILLLLAVIAFLADRLVREENQRYALWLGMCRSTNAIVLADFQCLEDVQTRTSWFWQLYYAVTDPLPAVPITSAG